MEVKVLGTGCPSCRAVYDAFRRVIEESDIKNVTLSKVEDLTDILTYNVASLPAVVIDGNARVEGYIPSESEVKILLNETSVR